MVCKACENQSSTINWKVHAAHCCKWHGCKYGNDDCPVAQGWVKQEYLCEQCDEDLENEPYLLQMLADIQEMKRFKNE